MNSLSNINYIRRRLAGFHMPAIPPHINKSGIVEATDASGVVWWMAWSNDTRSIWWISNYSAYPLDCADIYFSSDIIEILGLEDRRRPKQDLLQAFYLA